MSEVVLVMGAPSSGKSTLSEELVKKGYVQLERDKMGGKVSDLVPLLDELLKAGKKVVVDNLFATAESRRPFIKAAKDNKVTIRCELMGTSIEDSQINALNRMWNRHGRLFLDPASLKGVKDPNMFPIAVFFKYRKEFQKPANHEGFDKITTIPFVRKYPNYNGQAILLDYDGTLRETKSGSAFKFPTKPEEITILPNRTETLQQYKKQGYMLLGVSNQSGVAKGDLTTEQCEVCFEHTNKSLGVHVEKVVFCPHSVPPSCYCRKPQSGMGVFFLINQYGLDPRKCIFIGDSTTDKTFATRLGMQFEYPDEFFRIK